MASSDHPTIEIFYSYSHRDERLRQELEDHLSVLKRQGLISAWHDRKLVPGEEWAAEIDAHLNTAHVILLLISKDFLKSDYCYGKEMTRALERHARGEARVIPIILKPCDWEGAPFGALQALPRDAKAITTWSNRDAAFTNVAQGIRRTVEEVARRQAETFPADPPAPPPASPPPSAVPLPVPASLRQVLSERLSLAELRNAAFDLGLDDEGLAKDDLVRALLRHVEHRQATDRLEAWLRAQRPDLFAAAEPAAARPSPVALVPKRRAARRTQPTIPIPGTFPIPAGPFLRGTSDADIAWLVQHTGWAKEWRDRGWVKSEQPQRRIELAAFEIGRYPVTNREYAAFVAATGHAPPKHWDGTAPPESLADHPVVYVAYDDALAYCAWLSEQTGCPYRLPTEAEWEKAARGTDGRHYPWGAEFDPRKCNTAEGKERGTTRVGKYSPAGDSPYGCADMAGNVWEWCADWYAPDYYAEAPAANPRGPTTGVSRVVRGGAFLNNELDVRCASRDGNYPDFRNYIQGFRVVSPGL